MKPDQLREYPVVISLPIQWGDQDAFGHVNNTVAIRWFESSRIAYIETSKMGQMMEAGGIGPILVTEAGYVILGSPGATWDSPASQLCEPLAWFSTDGNVWELRTPESPFGSRASVWDIAGFGGRFVAIGSPWDEPATNVWVSDDGIDWRPVEVPQLGSVMGITGSELGWFLSGQTTTHYGDSTLAVDMWFSANGEVWDGPYPAPQGLLWVFFRHEPSAGTDAFVSVNGTHDGMVIGRLEE